MISVLGAGAFGTALAVAFARGGDRVTLWARDAQAAQDMQSQRENPRLPGVTLPKTVSVTADFTASLSDVILLAVPMQKLRGLLQSHPELSGRTLIACCKGVELGTQLGPVAVIRDVLPKATPAILTGPSFAADIARGLPTALTLATPEEHTGKALQQRLLSPNLRIYRTTDTVGAELGGALKNVIAIACGIAIGAGLGDSARAALMTRGYAEMQRMAQALGAQPDTLAGLSGFGDLTLTCSSDQSRNYRFGLSLGRGEDFDPSVTVEGAATARAAHARAKVMNIDMPITAAVVAILDGGLQIRDAMEMLLARPPKEE
ncbi:NAD(P)H-dependent glycerol-3-phosphate dehydrogenase [Shimia marina]|uniref:Glycerol-3-phosphate dehydrogenase [NAD(P)+] n=1 Tax=Shimia marina TaxID=321267 RepID=A0A0P1EM62_9RHOB|nr:NAD(P)H-dependent glycerol-3-phosphate dehydrogenase [Shimia marina]CUH51429.1 Glycerol-3-phosphate dehydrogenase [NAD(P)+] [Shimia marina]SFD49430.1 glycerol-3-phosphate dehydrogenase (NAD(P)+) [Shimia marina]